MNAEELDLYLSGDRIKCLLCGKQFRSLGHHLIKAHDVTVEDYKDEHGIPRTRSIAGAATRLSYGENVSATHAAGKLADVVEQLGGNRHNQGAASKAAKHQIQAAGSRSIQSPRIPHHKIEAVVQITERGVSLAKALREVGLSRAAYHRGLARHPDLMSRHMFVATKS